MQSDWALGPKYIRFVRSLQGVKCFQCMTERSINDSQNNKGDVGIQRQLGHIFILYNLLIWGRDVYTHKNIFFTPE